MLPTAERILHYGQDVELPAQIALTAGPLSMIFEHGTIRQVRLGSQVILQQIYAAVRDQNWGTVEPVFTNLQIIQHEQAFDVHFEATCIANHIDFRWQGTITGSAAGNITFAMDGKAHTDFLRNRIGFCVLHPPDCAGLPCTIEHVDGTFSSGEFPLHIAPHQPFYDIRAITYPALPDLAVEVRMLGDTFEMEDQRNWADASFKTYCTPLGLPFPAHVRQGDQIKQTISLRLVGNQPDPQPQTADLTITIADVFTPLPRIGLACSSDGRPLLPNELARLRALNLAHLRLDLDLSQPDFLQRLQQASSEALHIGAGLEVALILSERAAYELASLARILPQLKPPVLRWIILRRNEKSTAAKWVAMARDILAPLTPDAKIGSGTDAFFTELNRERPDVSLMDFVTFSTNPQVHASDNLSLVETLPIHAHLVTSTRHFAAQCPIIVSPVTFRMRWNPNATSAEAPPAPGQLPKQVDVRQMSLFGAGWTLGSLKYLAEAGVESVTYYETCGWLGVMETEQGSPLPEKFHSHAGCVFPMYHVFADLGSLPGASIVQAVSSDAMQVVALMIKNHSAQRLLIANLTGKHITVNIRGAAISGSFRSRCLDVDSAHYAMCQPDDFQAHTDQILSTQGEALNVSISPYGLLRLDAAQ